MEHSSQDVIGPEIRTEPEAEAQQRAEQIAGAESVHRSGQLRRWPPPPSGTDPIRGDWWYVRPAGQGCHPHLSTYFRGMSIPIIVRELEGTDPTGLEELRASCFGYLFRGATAEKKPRWANSIMAGQAMAELLHHECVFRYPVAGEEWGDDDAVWFRVCGRFIRYGRHEHALITGLRYGRTDFQLYSAEGPPVGGVFSRHRRVLKKATTDKVRIALKAGRFSGTPGDALKVAKVLAAFYLVLGYDGHNRGPEPWMWRLVEDRDAWEALPWGLLSWQVTRQYIRALVTAAPPRGPRRNSVHFYGHSLAFMVWACEAIPEMMKIFLHTRLEDPADQRPRLVRYVFKRVTQTMTWLQFFDTERECFETLTPTEEELAEPYMADLDAEIPPGFRWRRTSDRRKGPKGTADRDAQGVGRGRHSHGTPTASATDYVPSQPSVPPPPTVPQMTRVQLKRIGNNLCTGWFDIEHKCHEGLIPTEDEAKELYMVDVDLPITPGVMYAATFRIGKRGEAADDAEVPPGFDRPQIPQEPPRHPTRGRGKKRRQAGGSSSQLRKRTRVVLLSSSSESSDDMCIPRDDAGASSLQIPLPEYKESEQEKTLANMHSAAPIAAAPLQMQQESSSDTPAASENPRPIPEPSPMVTKVACIKEVVDITNSPEQARESSPIHAGETSMISAAGDMFDDTPGSPLIVGSPDKAEESTADLQEASMAHIESSAEDAAHSSPRAGVPIAEMFTPIVEPVPYSPQDQEEDGASTFFEDDDAAFLQELTRMPMEAVAPRDIDRAIDLIMFAQDEPDQDVARVSKLDGGLGALQSFLLEIKARIARASESHAESSHKAPELKLKKWTEEKEELQSKTSSLLLEKSKIEEEIALVEEEIRRANNKLEKLRSDHVQVQEELAETQAAIHRRVSSIDRAEAHMRRSAQRNALHIRQIEAKDDQLRDEWAKLCQFLNSIHP